MPSGAGSCRPSAACSSPSACKIPLLRRDARVAEGGALLRRYTGLTPYRGFESLSLRQYRRIPEQDPGCLARTRWLECSHRSIQRERTPNEHGYQEGNQCGGNSQRPALGGSAGTQSEGGRRVRLFGQEHRRVLPAQLCRFIENAEELPTLDELAQRARLSAYHLHRVFKDVTGLTPKAYANAHRAKRVRKELGSSATVTQAIYGAGYNSQGRFYEESNQLLGMTPTRYRAGGADTEIRFAVGECSLGSILVAQSERGVCAIMMGEDPDALARELQDQFPRAKLIGGDAGFEQLVAKVVGLVEAPGVGLDLPLDDRP